MWFQSYDRTYKQTNKQDYYFIFIDANSKLFKTSLVFIYASFWHTKKTGRGNWLGRDNGLRKVGGGEGFQGH